MLDAAIGKLLAKALELDEIADEVAQRDMDHGVGLARAAGFQAQVRVAHGKAWRAICDVADELDAAAIVLGARGSPGFSPHCWAACPGPYRCTRVGRS